MDVGMDTGDILTQRTTPIGDTDTGQTLHDRLAQIGAELLVETIPGYVAGKISPQAQDTSLATHAPKIKKEDGHIDWTQPATRLWHRLRAFDPWPGAFTFLPAQPKPKLLKIWNAHPISGERGQPGSILDRSVDEIMIACGEGALNIRELQLEGGRRMTAAEFLTGHPLKAGDRLG
jgi:methionyl-tRNA formyltransferase